MKGTSAEMRLKGWSQTWRLVSRLGMVFPRPSPCLSHGRPSSFQSTRAGWLRGLLSNNPPPGRQGPQIVRRFATFASQREGLHAYSNKQQTLARNRHLHTIAERAAGAKALVKGGTPLTSAFRSARGGRAGVAFGRTDTSECSYLAALRGTLARLPSLYSQPLHSRHGLEQ